MELLAHNYLRLRPAKSATETFIVETLTGEIQGYFSRIDESGNRPGWWIFRGGVVPNEEDICKPEGYMLDLEDSLQALAEDRFENEKKEQA
ncbi:hypothetical protein [Lacticaseibacillus sharpeae]|uniref:hypothetical protein n=1 Tax=Lacticaseibacillus sharpeae TaxID=1626 RepID=UPI0006D1EF6D|nr:hypothetical protein [Lacticaseibacillus sharpeae]